MKTIITAFILWAVILIYREIEHRKDKDKFENMCVEIVYDCITDVRVFKQEQRAIERFNKPVKENELRQYSHKVTIQYPWLNFQFGFWADYDKIRYYTIHPYTWHYSVSTIKIHGEYKNTFEFNSYSNHIYPIYFGSTQTSKDTTYFTERWEETEIFTLNI